MAEDAPKGEAQPVAPSPIEEEGGWKEFLWNSEHKTVLGRSGKSWWDIFVFYIIFFISLILFFMLSWYISLLAVDIHQPYKHGKGSLLWEKGPGLTFRPAPDKDTNGVSTMIWFTPGAVHTGHSFWSGQLKDWMDMMPTSTKTSGGSTTTNNNIIAQSQCTDSSKDKPCEIVRADFGECDGLGDDTFGYAVGEPCILLKLNRIYDWVPELHGKKIPEEYGPKDSNGKEVDEKIKVPKGIIEAFDSLDPAIADNAIPVWCEGEFLHDKENLGPIEYYPGPYIHKKYFPYKNFKDYQSPFVMVKLKRPMAGALLSLVCRAFAKNLHTSRETGVGYARIQILMGD